VSRPRPRQQQTLPQRERLVQASISSEDVPQGSKIFYGFRDGISEQTHHDATAVGGAVDLDVKVNLVGDFIQIAVVCIYTLI